MLSVLNLHPIVGPGLLRLKPKITMENETVQIIKVQFPIEIIELGEKKIIELVKNSKFVIKNLDNGLVITAIDFESDLPLIRLTMMHNTSYSPEDLAKLVQQIILSKGRKG